MIAELPVNDYKLLLALFSRTLFAISCNCIYSCI